jgi:chromosome segregation ATPase
MENQLEVIVKESGLEQTKAKFILDNFTSYFKLADEWEKKAKMINVTSAEQLSDMKIARVGRLELREKRIELEKARKKLKEQALREGKAIDGIANVLKALIVPIEEYLYKQENFVKIQEEAKKEQMRIEAEKKAEEERIAKEKAEAEERERVRLENERLKKEAEERERVLAEERRKAEKEKADAAKKQKEMEDQARKEREEAEAKKKEAERKAKEEQERIKKEADEKLKAEKEKAIKTAEEVKKHAEQQIEAEKEKARIEAEKIRKEKEAVEERLNLIECPHCHKKFSISKEKNA